MRVPGVVRAATMLALIAPFMSASAQLDADRFESHGNAGEVLGITVSVSGVARDTIGVLIESVSPGSPAARAGLEEGERIAEVNGLSVRVSPEDVGRREAEDLVRRRFARTLRSVQPGDAVTLRVFAGSRGRTVTIQLSRSRPTEEPSDASTLAEVLESLRETQARMRRLAEREASVDFADTLAQAERELAELQHRLREAEMLERRRPTRESARRESSRETLPGLRVTVVSEELTPYFGDRSERGLLVLEADEAWTPLRTGDVIIRVEGRRATVEALRDALDDRRVPELEVLRRERVVTVTIDGLR
ncbi:MAG: PDZ domain-containing protein [Gemmatimonadaceae bacterium]